MPFALSVVVVWLCARAVALAPAALAPRASAPPIAYYRPPWQCPTSYQNGATTYPVLGSGVRPGTYNAATVDTFYCEAVAVCFYDLSTGLIQPTNSPSWCTPSVEPNMSCAYECPLSNGIAVESLLTSVMLNYTAGSTVVDRISCYYGYGTETGVGTSYDSACAYDFITASGKNKTLENCLGPLTLDCGATTTRRRQYRKEDNFTAWLARKGLRESQRAAAAPQPAQRPNPFGRRT
ncbi:hypothetical protein C8R45DRAFT_1112530 [Mycena sanguinolenta]|nr:hypothetical protein C8R45DRAFT_1112530 [Mycena sanguinolenta]